MRASDHTFDVLYSEWSVTGDAGALERTVLNLLDNAVKFSPANSTITTTPTGRRMTSSGR